MINTVNKNEIILSGEFKSDDLGKIIEICMEELDKFVIHFHMNAEMTATVHVKDGILEDAILGPYGGLHVLALLSDEVEGSYDLCTWHEPESYSINLVVSSALLTAAVQFDENKHRLRKTIKDTIEHIKHSEDPFSLSGSLDKIKLEQLLNYISGLNKSCKIDMEISPELSAQIFFDDNLVLDAKLGELTGVQALSLILEHAQSKYIVTETSADLKRNINLSIDKAIAAARDLL